MQRHPLIAARAACAAVVVTVAAPATAQDDGPPPTPTYEEAFADLYHDLGARYPCFALKNIDWDAVGAELLPRAREVMDDVTFGRLSLELVARLEDNHARLIDGTAKVPWPEPPRWSPGFSCLLDDRNEPVVYAVLPGSPAAAAGIEVGMTVNAIDGVPAAEALTALSDRFRRWVGYSSDRCLRHDLVRALVRRELEGALVHVEITDLEGHDRTLRLAATLENVRAPRLPVPIPEINEGANLDWTMLDGDIGYISLRRIRDDLVSGLDRAIADLAGARGLIIDVRGNGGGGFDARRSHLNFDLDRADEEPERPRFRGPIAVLVDSRCISAGEGWTSWFVATKRAALFGETTAGASARKVVEPVKGGLYQVRFPVKAYTGFLDRWIERRGLEPNVYLRPTAEHLAAGQDTVLEAARRYVIKKADRAR